jgi:hypothetical protein
MKHLTILILTLCSIASTGQQIATRKTDEFTGSKVITSAEYTLYNKFVTDRGEYTITTINGVPSIRVTYTMMMPFAIAEGNELLLLIDGRTVTFSAVDMTLSTAIPTMGGDYKYIAAMTYLAEEPADWDKLKSHLAVKILTLRNATRKYCAQRLGYSKSGRAT